MKTTALLPAPSDDPVEMARQALALGSVDPEQAFSLLDEAARSAIRLQQPRVAALVLHRRAALALDAGRSPVADLAMAARLLESLPADRALVLLDLGQALGREGDARRATMALWESELLARGAGNYELSAAARHALSRIAEEQGDFSSARTFLRSTGQALIYDAERDLLATLRDMGNLPHDPASERERERREGLVEEELATLKREMGLSG